MNLVYQFSDEFPPRSGSSPPSPPFRQLIFLQLRRARRCHAQPYSCAFSPSSIDGSGPVPADGRGISRSCALSASRYSPEGNQFLDRLRPARQRFAISMAVPTCDQGFPQFRRVLAGLVEGLHGSLSPHISQPRNPVIEIAALASAWFSERQGLKFGLAAISRHFEVCSSRATGLGAGLFFVVDEMAANVHGVIRRCAEGPRAGPVEGLALALLPRFRHEQPPAHSAGEKKQKQAWCRSSGRTRFLALCAIGRESPWNLGSGRA